MREIERRSLLGDIAGAQQLTAAVAEKATGPEGKLRDAATAALDTLARGALVRHVIGHFRKANDADVTALTRLCQTIGPRLVLPFAEALSTEDHTHTIRRIRELLISFGAEGRRAVEPLKNSTKPAVRRTAVDLLRIFGGNDALKELTPLLNDADPQVQRDAVRAIVQIGTPEAFAVIDRGCEANDAARELIVREVIGMRDTRAVPSLSAVLKTHLAARGRGRPARGHHRRARRPGRPRRLHGGAARRAGPRRLVGAAPHGGAAQGGRRRAQAHRLTRNPRGARRRAAQQHRGVRAAARLALGREGAVR